MRTDNFANIVSVNRMKSRFTKTGWNKAEIASRGKEFGLTLGTNKTLCLELYAIGDL
jgi:hypothetical protein